MKSGNLDKLTAAEKAVLTLLAQGHDTKSASARLGISMHAITDRLREARRKLGVTSSREAARMLSEREGEGTQKLSGQFSGGDSGGTAGQVSARHGKMARFGFGAIIMSAFVFALYLFASGPVEATAPRVVSVSPAQGSIVAPGPFTLTVTFDRPMRDQSWSFVQVSADSYPDCSGPPARSRDGRSFSLRCVSQPGKRYEVWFNRGQFRNFRAQDGTPAQPFGLRFAVRR